MSEIQLKSYQYQVEGTGQVKNKYKYLTGAPRQYRFNGQAGTFNLEGKADIGRTFKLQPIAWRFFNDQLFGRDQIDEWVEIFFIDEKNNVSAMMFNNVSASRLRDVWRELFYDDLRLNDVVFTITSEKMENAKGQKYYAAIFNYAPADSALVDEQEQFATDFKIFRQDTITPTADLLSASTTYFWPDHDLIIGPDLAPRDGLEALDQPALAASK